MHYFFTLINFTWPANRPQKRYTISRKRHGLSDSVIATRAPFRFSKFMSAKPHRAAQEKRINCINEESNISRWRLWSIANIDARLQETIYFVPAAEALQM